MPFYTYPLIYFITSIIGLIFYKKFRHNWYLKLFLFFIVYTFFSECVGFYLGIYLKISNAPIYTIWNTLNFLFYGFFILNIIKNNLKAAVIKFCMVLFCLILLVNLIFFSNFFVDHLVNNTLLAKSLVVVFILIYFIEVLQSDQVLTIHKSLNFWILFGAFIYNIGFLPAFALVKYTSFFGTFKYITFSLNILMHLCFITGFIISKKGLNG